MENSRVFIGNLDFAVTEEEIRVLFSDYGTVIHIKLHKKKGYAFIEMSSEAEAALAIEKLNGGSFKDREIRVSLELKAKKAKTLSIKKYNERSERISRERKSRNPDRIKPDETGHYSMKDEHKKNGPSGPRHRNNRPAARRQDDSPSPAKRWRHDNPAQPGRPQREGRKPGGDGSPHHEINYNSWERFPGPNATPAKVDARVKSDSPRPRRKEWSHDKPAYQDRNSRDGRKSGYGRSPKPHSDYKSRERFSGPDDRPSRDYPRGRSESPHPQRREWSHDKPSHSNRPSGPSRQPGGRTRDDATSWRKVRQTGFPSPSRRQATAGKSSGKLQAQARGGPVKTVKASKER